MKEYHANSIRNVALLGHMGSGKTSLAEALLFAGKAIDKKGEVEKKNTVGDYTPEEQNKQTTLSTSLIPVEWKGTKINFLDTPGSEEFIGELDNVLSVSDAAILLIDASKGIEVGTERCFEELRKTNTPTFILLNKMDKENVKFDKVFGEVKEAFGDKVMAFAYPVGGENNFKGVALTVEGKEVVAGKEGPLSAYQSEIEADKEALYEKAAETSEELLDKYMEELMLEDEDLKAGLKVSIANGDLFPLICAADLKNNSVDVLLDLVVDYLPTLLDRCTKAPKDPASGAVLKRAVKDDEAVSAYIFKTIVDPFVGTINLFKIYSGTVKTGNEYYIQNIDETIKMPQIFSMMGKTQIALDQAFAGDIVAVSKLPELQTGFTICDKKNPALFDMPEYPTPVIYYAIQPKQKQDEEKISTALQKLSQEDPTFEFKRNPETAQLLIGGQGSTHIGYILEKLKNSFKVEVGTDDPKVVYRETIKGKTDQHGVQGKHKKQSGGAGQYGDVWIRFETTTEPFEFHEEVFGGSVPKNYFPAVEKGLKLALEKGPLAGFPVIGVKATLTDGSYHPVDSNELSFVLAAKLSWENACAQGTSGKRIEGPVIKPTILEPIMELHIIIKDEYVGSVMGDMSKRRGRILGQNAVGNGKTEIVAEVPEAEIVKYANDLKAMTQASGRFSRTFLRYDQVPEEKIKKIIEENHA